MFQPRLLTFAVAAGLLLSSGAAPVFAAERQSTVATPITADDWVARVDQLRDNARWLEALTAAENGLAAHPDSPALYRLRVFALLDIGTHHRAYTLYRARRDLFHKDEASRLEGAELARRINWSGLYAADEERRLDEAHAAEAALVDYEQWALETGTPRPPNLRFDRLLLLNKLARHQEVVDGYHEALANGLTVPDYALGAIGDSLLALRNPSEASSVLRRALAVDPGNVDLTILLAYADLERERFDLAVPAMRDLTATQSPWLSASGARMGHENWRRYDAETTYAMIQAFAEDLPAAQARLESLVRVGPRHSGTQDSLGSVYRFRGWTERALERYRMASTLDERNVNARLGQVATLSELNRYDLARPIHDELLSLYPNSAHVISMDRNWRLARGWGGRVYGVSGRSDGADMGSNGNSPFGNRDVGYGVELRGPLIDYRWRWYASTDHRSTDFQEQDIRMHRTDVGIEYAFDRWQARATVGRASDGIGGTGAALSARWRKDDRWVFGGAIRLNDSEASLQAHGSGISADSVMFNADYSHNERTSAGVSVSQLRYDDGNRRDRLSAAGGHRFISRPHLQVEVLGNASASRSSLDGAPYFNPSRDASGEIGIRLDHIGWRRYERSFRERLTASVGSYWQEGFGNHGIPMLRYEHEWRFETLGNSLLYGVSWSRPVYDGNREERVAFDLEYRWGNSP